LVAGSLYYNSDAGAIKLYNGTAWVAAYISGTGFAALNGATFTGNVTVPNLITSGNVDGRDVSTDGTKLDGIESGATADQTAAEILTAVKSVDGTGSGLDGDLLDGQEGSYYLDYNNFTSTPSIPSNNNQLTNGAGYITGNQTITLSGDVSGSGTTSIAVTIADDSHNHIISNVDGLQTELDAKLPLSGGTMTGAVTFAAGQTFDGRDVSADGAKLDGIEAGATADQTAAEILTLIKTVDGAGSGLAADTLDGVNSTQFLRSDAADTKTSGDLNFSDNVKATFGAGDLQIYHDGTNSWIQDSGTGNLLVTGGSEVRITTPSATEFMARFINNGDVKLYYDNVEKFATTATGCAITGNVNSSGYIESGEGSGSVALTTNDGHGNANLTFNHNAGIPDVNGSSYRIEAAVDGASAYMNFELASSTTAGVAVNLPTILRLDPQGADVTGAITATGDITAFSDERLKSDITTINNALDKVTAMRGVTFTKDGKVGSGVIAQEMEKVAPELVRTEEYKSVAYGNLVGYLIEAIKELKAEIEDLKNGSTN
jgi:hypothetical protein